MHGKSKKQALSSNGGLLLPLLDRFRSITAITVHANAIGVEPYHWLGGISPTIGIIHRQHSLKFLFLACPAMATSLILLSRL